MSAGDGGPDGPGDDATDSAGVDDDLAGRTMFGVPAAEARGQTSVFPPRESYLDVVAQMRIAGFWQCVDLCAVDYLGYSADRNLPESVTGERFEVVSQHLNHRTSERVRVRVQVPDNDPTCPSLFALHPGTDAPEREAFDLFGINFDGHPHLERILLPDEWDGHPLRKDAPIGRIPVQFSAAADPRSGR